MLNQLESNITSSLFDRTGTPVNLNQPSAANEPNVTAYNDVDINTEDIVMDNYDTLTLEDWMNHYELFVDFNDGLTIPIHVRKSTK